MNESCGDGYEGFEAQVCFTRAHGYPSVFLQFTEVVFDQVPPFVSFLVELCRELPVGFRRYDWGDATIQQVIAQPISIECSVRQKVPGGQISDQRVSLAQVMSLSGHQTEINEVAERIGQRQYFRRYPSARAANGLAESPPFAP